MQGFLQQPASQREGTPPGIASSTASLAGGGGGDSHSGQARTARTGHCRTSLPSWLVLALFVQLRRKRGGVDLSLGAEERGWDGRTGGRDLRGEDLGASGSDRVCLLAMPGYYNIEDILMEEEPISVVFHVTANGVGLLDPGAETNCVEKGAKVELPFWLAHGLLSLEQAVSINVPPCFTQKTRKEIQADAACVDLRVRCPYFYELGCKIVPLVTDKSIGLFLRYAFTSRYKEILSKSHSSSVMAMPKFVPRLTREETQVFESARESMTAFKKWRVGGVRMQKASILGRKRKTKLPDGPSTP